MSKIKLLICIVMTFILCIMTLGYAALQERIDLEVQASIDSTYKVQINSVSEKSTAGDGRSTQVPSYNNLTATFHVGLTNTTDVITYEIEVENLGTVDAILNNAEILVDGSNNIRAIKSGIRNGDILLASSLKVITITVELKKATSEEQTATITVNLDYTRLKGGTGEIVDEGDYSNLLPTGYKECEYLESTGTQYIDTGYQAPKTIEHKIFVDFQLVELPQSDKTVMGYDLNDVKISSNGYIMGNTSYPYIGLDRRSITIEYLPTNDGASHTMIMDTDDNQHVQRTSTYWPTDTSLVTIYTNSKYISTRKSKAKIYSAKIYEDSILERHFVPVLDNHDVACFYDIVTGDTFYNQGTGTFAYKLRQ